MKGPVSRTLPALPRQGVLVNRYRGLQVRVGRTRWGSWLIVHILSPLDRLIYRLSGGRASATGPLVFPTLLLTTTGRKSGKPRTRPVLYLRDGNCLIICAGNTAPGGAQWPKNLAANPRARVQLGRRVFNILARPADADETTRYWSQLAALYPPYATYQQRNATPPRVFVLERINEVVES